jgi:hypothetical protein
MEASQAHYGERQRPLAQTSRGGGGPKGRKCRKKQSLSLTYVEEEQGER